MVTTKTKYRFIKLCNSNKGDYKQSSKLIVIEKNGECKALFPIPFFRDRLVVMHYCNSKRNSRLVEPTQKINCIINHKGITSVRTYVRYL